ncbi:ATP-binding protein [Kordiimonas sp. SCSIO 12610]|uniref:ATP-binding protein n=1 Tax=Kordiimonas sp. SCSIO 12610 TaxID=2829597 RepID=UPI00210922FF|nr:ATP-binding protein [Kordiimonas sp. SCSIO 12610]UTW54144.1 ATP-binding protein [Kordiimonas sp. SCSIO 12610]
MATTLAKIREKISARLALVFIVIVMALLWFFNHIDLFATVILSLSAAFILFQMEVKYRRRTLKKKRKTAQNDRRIEQEGIMSLRTHALNGLPSPTLLIDHKRRILFANDSAKELLDDELNGKDISLFLRQPKFIDAITKALNGEVDTENDSFIRYTSNSERSFDVTIAPIKPDNSTENHQATIFFYEVTSLLKTEQMRVDFVANASHELRTPLTSLMGFIETLQGPAKEDLDAHHRFLGIMQKEADRMVLLVDDLLSLSRIEMARYQAPETPAKVELIIGNALDSIEKLAEKRGITLRTEFEADLPLAILDTGQITQVLLNLLTNAAKYADQDSTVHIVAQRNNGNHIEIIVRDEGPGIPPEHLARLTERFYRVDTARSREMGGTGLGLAIVKHILLRHNSQLNIRSTVGEGTSFSFRLQIAEPDSNGTDQKSSAITEDSNAVSAENRND